MAKIQYVYKKFNAAHRAIIDRANTIIDDYEARGFRLTLRQLYYRFVAAGAIPNTMQSYKMLGSIINDARLAGLIDWERIEDRTRELSRLSRWQDPDSFLRIVAPQYHHNFWTGQSNYVEVWVEKEALAGIIESAAQPFDVNSFPCRGYVSQSTMWEAAMRLRRKEREGKQVVILHFGDHDPSGIDMTRDNEDRLRLFGVDPIVERLALNFDQIQEFNPPPNPAKSTDARYASYLAVHGDESWELDSLEPDQLVALVTSGIEKWIDDPEDFEDRKREEADNRKTLELIADHYDDVKDFTEEQWPDEEDEDPDGE